MGKGLVEWITGQWDGIGASVPLCSLIPASNPSPSHPCSSPGAPQRCPGNTWQPGCRDAAPGNSPAIPAPAASAAATSSSSGALCGQGPGCINWDVPLGSPRIPHPCFGDPLGLTWSRGPGPGPPGRGAGAASWWELTENVPPIPAPLLISWLRCLAGGPDKKGKLLLGWLSKCP